MATGSPTRDEHRFWTGILVAAQRRPWAGAAVAAFVVIHAFALPLGLMGTRFESPVTRAALGVVAASAAAHAVVRSPSWFERVAALVVSNFIVIVFGLRDVLLSPRSAADVAVPLSGVAFAVVWALVAPHEPVASRALRAVELIAVAAVAGAASVTADLGRPATVAGIFALPVVTGAFVRAEGRFAALWGFGAVMGLAFGGVHLAVGLERLPPAGDATAILAGSTLAGALFAALAAAARVARSFTAVPKDHPSFTDFVDGEPRGT